MNVDLELYRREVRVSREPLVRLSAIELAPEHYRRTFLFLHGFGGQALQWRYQLQRYSNENRVIALDLRGHGQSDRPASGYGMGEIIRDVEKSLEILTVREAVVLVGHSFGGAIAAEFAAKFPEKLEALILISTSAEFRLNYFYRFGLNLPHGVLRLLAFFTRGWLSAPPHTLKRFYDETLSSWKGWDIFPKIHTPTLVIRGHGDRVFERPLFEEVSRAIPGAVEADIGVSGHMVMLERRDAVARAIDRFLEGKEKLSWREVREASTSIPDEKVSKGRPWLNSYPEGVPPTISIPPVTVNQLLRSAVRRFPSHTAVRFKSCRISYRRLNHEVNRFANALQHLGIGKGARVALLMPNLPQMVESFFGVLKAGMVAVFIPPLTEPEELIRQIRDSEASVLVTMRTWAGLARRIQENTELPHVILTDAADCLPFPVRVLAHWRDRNLWVPGAISFRRFKAGQSHRSPLVDVFPEDLAVIQYTGGTTAEAKGVMLSHRNLVANALQTRHWMPEAEEGKERFLCVLPFSHSYGLTTAMTVPIAFGATLILIPQFQVKEVLQTIKRYKPTIFPGVPSMYMAINAYRGVRKFGIQSIKACISGSAPLPVEVQEAFEKLTKGRLVEGYGLTEASPVTHANPLKGRRKVGSIGIPLPSTQAMIVDLKSGRKEVPVGQIGELAVRGPQVMMGYWKNHQATEQVLTPDGWLLTGDVAQRDEDGYFRIIARKAEMWYPEKPGRPAFPRDVEEVIYEIPQVKETAVVAIAGQPIAFVIAGEEKPSTEAVIAYCKRRLPPALVPRLVLFVEDFPRSFIGKVLRRELAKRYGQQISR